MDVAVVFIVLTVLSVWAFALNPCLWGWVYSVTFFVSVSVERCLLKIQIVILILFLLLESKQASFSVYHLIVSLGVSEMDLIRGILKGILILWHFDDAFALALLSELNILVSAVFDIGYHSRAENL